MSTTAVGAVVEASTALFVPAHRPDRYVKALAAGAGAVILDLEDAVAPADKTQALQNVRTFLASAEPLLAPVLVRLNASCSPWVAHEVEALARLAADHPSRLAGVVVPKAEDAGRLSALAERLERAAGAPLAVVALIESARGVLRAPELAAARGVTRLALGAVDLGVDLDAQADADVLSAARSALVLASAAARLPGPLDAPSTAVREPEEVRWESRRAAKEGFGGKLCIHPAQLPVVREAFAPSDADVDWARRVLAVVGDETSPAVEVDGRMVDRPVVLRAQRVLQRYEETTS